jgi:hypothetical protein
MNFSKAYALQEFGCSLQMIARAESRGYGQLRWQTGLNGRVHR